MWDFWASGPEWPPHPQTPFLTPQASKKVVNLLFIEWAFICLLITYRWQLVEELQGKTRYAHALALTTCLVHIYSQNLCQLLIFIYATCAYCNATNLSLDSCWPCLNQGCVICHNHIIRCIGLNSYFTVLNKSGRIIRLHVSPFFRFWAFLGNCLPWSAFQKAPNAVIWDIKNI